MNFIHIPSSIDDSFDLELSRLEKGRFLLTTKNSFCPFYINGQAAISSWVMRGDKVDICNNRITFLEEQRDQPINSFEQYIPSSAITNSDLNILLEGETGTGKSTLAKQIHDLGRKNGPFVHLNLESFPESLIESELFGHVKGAFTGAIQHKRGALAMAHNGTLFLDEIDSLANSIQCKLLLFLDNKKFMPVGSDQGFYSNTRFIIATSSNLKDLIASGRMRKDFYYRIASGEQIKIPPLRENKKLIEHLCKEMEKEFNIIISDKLLAFYKSLPWPGNIRQLRQHLYKKSLLSTNHNLIYEKEDEELIGDPLGDSFDNEYYDMRSYQYLIAQKIFQKLGGHLNKSAKILNLSPATLREMLKIPPPSLTKKMIY